MFNFAKYKDFLVGMDEEPGVQGIFSKRIGWIRRYRFKFNNGFGASVVKGYGTYGGEEDLWELAVITFDEDGRYYINSSNPITENWESSDDVMGWLTDEDVDNYLEQIKNLETLHMGL